jgi:hypothetical protein
MTKLVGLSLYNNIHTTAVQVEAASGAVIKGTHLCPAKVTVLAQGLRYTLETNI